MVEQTHRIVTASESDIHAEPHIVDSRITVRFVQQTIEESGVEPDRFAERYDLDVADVYHALAYYHDHPAEMAAVAGERADVIETYREQAVTGPDDVE